MKILCELISRETRERITSTEVQANCFGIVSNNPFPASEPTSAVFNSVSAIVTYVVAKAPEAA